MEDRNCNECVYSTRDGFCRRFECAGTVTVEDIKAEARQSAIDEFADKIKEYSREHYLDCDGYYGGQTELVFRTEDFLDEILEQLKEQKNG